MNMKNTIRKTQPSKSLLVTGLVLATIGGVALARQNRKNGHARIPVDAT
jgi:hypothetical protein